MSTYLPNVKDYIPEVKAYTPDFKFLSDALDSRQDRYNYSTQQLNNIYGEVVYSDLSREDNKSIRDQYTENLAPKIQQISGLDLSLQQNVQAAKGLFKPFYEDEHIVRDIVFTKAYKDQMKLANTYKNSATSEERERYWEDGIKFMNYQMQDFQEKSRSESMELQLPQYTENPNLYERGLESLYSGGPDGKGLIVTDMFVDGTGQFIVTQENGVTLTSKPTGNMIENPKFNPEKKESKTNPKLIPEMYNPAGERIKNAVLIDPLVQQGLRVKAYVQARDWYEEQAKQTGQPVDIFKRQWAETQIKLYEEQTGQILKTEKEELNKVNKSLSSWQAYTKDAPLIEGSDEYLQWFFDMTAASTIQSGIDEIETRNKDILSQLDTEDLDALMNRGYAAFITMSVAEDIFNVSRQYSDETFKRTFKESKIYLEKLRHSNNVALEQLKQRNILMNKLQENLDAINAASVAPNAIPGSEDNQFNYGSLVEKNESAELKVINEGFKEQIKGIVSFYTFMADDLNGDINLQNMANLTVTDENKNSGEVSTAGIFIPNLDANKLQFYRWEDSYEALMAHPDILLYHYNHAMNVHNDPDAYAASYKNEEMADLRAVMSSIENNIKIRNTKLKIIKDKQQEVYNNVIADIDLSQVQGGYGKEAELLYKNFQAELFDENGYMISSKDLYNDKIQEIANGLKGSIPQYLPSKQDIMNKWSVNGDGVQWITTDDDPNSPITPQALQQRIREQGQWVGPYSAAYFGLVSNNPLGMDGQKFMNKYYSSQKKPWVSIPVDQKIPLLVKPGSNMNAIYTDIAKDHLEWGGFQTVIDKVKERINDVMTDDLAINGVTTFDFNSYYYGDGTVGDMAYAPVIPYRYDAGTLDRYVNSELDYFFNAIDKLPKSQIIPMTGDHGGTFSSEVNEVDQRLAYMIINQIRADRNYKPGNTSKASDPGYRIEYSSVGGGSASEGNYAMYKFILDSDYAAYISKNLPLESAQLIQDNTITVFLNKDLFSNPLDPDQQHKSVVKTMITMPGNQGRATINVANGGVIHFEMNNGLITQKYAAYSYNPINGNMELSNFSAPQPLIDGDPNSRGYGLPITDINVDSWYEEQRLRLNQLAETNLTAQKNHKLRQSGNNIETDDDQMSEQTISLEQ